VRHKHVKTQPTRHFLVFSYVITSVETADPTHSNSPWISLSHTRVRSRVPPPHDALHCSNLFSWVCKLIYIVFLHHILSAISKRIQSPLTSRFFDVKILFTLNFFRSFLPWLEIFFNFFIFFFFLIILFCHYAHNIRRSAVLHHWSWTYYSHFIIFIINKSGKHLSNLMSLTNYKQWWKDLKWDINRSRKGQGIKRVVMLGTKKVKYWI